MWTEINKFQTKNILLNFSYVDPVPMVVKGKYLYLMIDGVNFSQKLDFCQAQFKLAISIEIELC